MYEAPNMMGSGLGGPRAAAAEELEGDMQNPASEGEGDELLIPAALFPKGCKEGDTYTVSGIVGKMGSKVSFTPTGTFKPGATEAAHEVEEESVEQE